MTSSKSAVSWNAKFFPPLIFTFSAFNNYSRKCCMFSTTTWVSPTSGLRRQENGIMFWWNDFLTFHILHVKNLLFLIFRKGKKKNLFPNKTFIKRFVPYYSRMTVVFMFSVSWCWERSRITHILAGWTQTNIPQRGGNKTQLSPSKLAAGFIFLFFFQQTCAVCLEEFCSRDELGVCPCSHAFHKK